MEALKAGPGAQPLWAPFDVVFFHSRLISMQLLILPGSQSLPARDMIIAQGTSILSGLPESLAGCKWLSVRDNPTFSSCQI